MGVLLPALAVLAAMGRTGSVVLVQGAELREGSGEAVLFVSALEAGQDTLAKQILSRLHLQEIGKAHIFSLLWDVSRIVLRRRLWSHQIHR